MHSAAIALQLADILPPDEIIFGAGAAMRAVQEKLEKLSDTNIPVLLQGESGTGKEIIAKLIHQRSSCPMGPFVKVNCPAIPDTLLESELFGYKRGAFTGAFTAKPGRVEMAECGTLFLDEISELGLSLQSKLLQVLQNGRFCPIGGCEDKQVDVRVVCATNRNLQQEVESGRFRRDLYYRINVLPLQLPPLRERLADLPGLVEYFLHQNSTRYHVPLRTLSSATMALMASHNWPGNIRELENLTKRFSVLGSEDVITNDLRKNGLVADLRPDISLQGPISLKEVTREAMKTLELKIIVHVLQGNQWNRKRAARALSISYRSLLYKLKEAGLDQRPEINIPASLQRVGEDKP